MSLGGIDLFHKIFHPLLFQTLSVPTPFPYLYPVMTPEECRDRCLDHFRALCEDRAHQIAALVVEPLVQGAAGMIVHPPGFLKGLRRICSEHDILLICDEVATGFGRTGKMFAVEHEDVCPDILALAKGLSGGYLPLAATLVTDEIYQAFLGEHAAAKTFFHGHSYTGNALACAAACACLDVFESDRVLEAAPSKIALLAEQLEPRDRAPAPRGGCSPVRIHGRDRIGAGSPEKTGVRARVAHGRSSHAKREETRGDPEATG